MQLLPRLKTLSQIHLKDFIIELPLLTVLQSHPVTSIVIEFLTDWVLPTLLELDSNGLDLSKIVIKHGSIPGQDGEVEFLRSYLAYGLQMKEVFLPDPNMSEGLSFMKFQGLSCLQLYLDEAPVSLSWLPKFIETHPLLEKVTFSNWNRGSIVRFLSFRHSLRSRRRKGSVIP
ncbi:hypothetical protein BT96DRAFT_547845 [Gymnopus androsaceus JB14]|uniref:F-box domain-containing protein n=1 Tax=Gymnopus androsaceus JB14 TaxID=1447944 RepID=A0A6A4HVJ7_9AGAR|nr:hypothetical protein BT96DRAFT_547845 [Gymnopus androsaceus JB14]